MLIQEILKLSGSKEDSIVKAWVGQVNNLFPKNPLNDKQRVAIFGDNENPVTVVFELIPSREKGRAEIAWIQASPRKSGGASRLIRFLQNRAKGKGISLVLTPQRNGEIGGDALADIYKGLGFKHDKEKDVMVWESEIFEMASEYDIKPDNSSTQKLVSEIQKNCSEMLDAYRKTGKVLYRGIDGATADIVRTSIRKNRQPLQMDQEFHDALHKAFLRNGIKATRKNSIFCSTSKTTADAWGRAYVIFVKDGWSGTVFEARKRDYAFYAMRDIGSMIVDSNAADDIIDSKILKLKPMTFDDSGGLQKVLNTKFVDILITGDSYIAISADLFKQSKFDKLLGITK